MPFKLAVPFEVLLKFKYKKVIFRKTLMNATIKAESTVNRG